MDRFNVNETFKCKCGKEYRVFNYNDENLAITSNTKGVNISIGIVQDQITPTRNNQHMVILKPDFQCVNCDNHFTDVLVVDNLLISK